MVYETALVMAVLQRWLIQSRLRGLRCRGSILVLLGEQGGSGKALLEVSNHHTSSIPSPARPQMTLP